MVSRDDIATHIHSDVVYDGETWPWFVHSVDHPDGLVLVDTGMLDWPPELADEWQPTPHPLPQALVDRVSVVVNTHLHFDHCGGNRLFPGLPIHVQARELEDARTRDRYTIREWVDFPGATYVEHEGEAEILPGVRLMPAPGHTEGHQIVVVETDEGTVVLGGDVGVSFTDIGLGDTPGKRLVLELGAPTYLAHAANPHVPRLNA